MGIGWSRSQPSPRQGREGRRAAQLLWWDGCRALATLGMPLEAGERILPQLASCTHGLSGSPSSATTVQSPLSRKWPGPCARTPHVGLAELLSASRSPWAPSNGAGCEELPSPLPFEEAHAEVSLFLYSYSQLSTNLFLDEIDEI